MSILTENEDKKVRWLIRTILEQYEEIRSKEEPVPVIAESTLQDTKNTEPTEDKNKA